jgi:hypothetical protein
MATSDKIDNARTRAGSRPRLNMFNAAEDMQVTIKSATEYELNANGACSENSNSSLINDDNRDTTYEEIDSNYDELNISCTHVDNSNITTNDDDINITYEEIDTVHDEPNFNHGDLANTNNEPDATYEEVDAVYDVYYEADAPPPSGLQVTAMAIYNATSPSQPSANAQRPALPRPADSDQEYAEATYASDANWWTKNM